jgi:hypothetical protein
LASTEVPAPDTAPGASRPTRVEVGVIAPPGLDEKAVAELAVDLAELLYERYPEVEWDISYVLDPLVEPPVPLTELVDATRARMLEEGWDLAVLVTELPLRLDRRPLLSHASPSHGVALVSLPAHGVVRVSRRLRDSMADAVSALVGDSQLRLLELATDVEDGDEGIAFPLRVIGGNLRLLLGMIRANRPWRLVVSLSRALVGALAVATVTLILSDVWHISSSLDDLRLAALMLLAIATAIVALIVVHGLWERSVDPAAREQVMLFNITTLATIALAVVSLYAEAFVIVVPASALLIDSSLFGQTVGHAVGVADYLRLDWLVCSLATVGGALGSALESDAAVREAAYAHRPERERMHA